MVLFPNAINPQEFWIITSKLNDNVIVLYEFLAVYKQQQATKLVVWNQCCLLRNKLFILLLQPPFRKVLVYFALIWFWYIHSGHCHTLHTYLSFYHSTFILILSDCYYIKNLFIWKILLSRCVGNFWKNRFGICYPGWLILLAFLDEEIFHYSAHL